MLSAHDTAQSTQPLEKTYLQNCSAWCSRVRIGFSQVLQALKDQHPVVELILEHRTLAKLLKSTIDALLQEAKPVRPSETFSDGLQPSSEASERGAKHPGKPPRLQKIYGTWLHTAAATGRLAMEDPSLQCIQHSISFSIEGASARRRSGGTEERNQPELSQWGGDLGAGVSGGLMEEIVGGMTTKAGHRDQTLAEFGAAQRRKSGTEPDGMIEIRTAVGQTVTSNGRNEQERNGTRQLPRSSTESSRRLSGNHSRRVEVNIRSVFVPASHSWALMSADYAQIEVRMMAHFSGDTGLLALLSTPGGDLFRMIAAKWASVEESEVLPKQREAAKHLTYG